VALDEQQKLCQDRIYVQARQQVKAYVEQAGEFLLKKPGIIQDTQFHEVAPMGAKGGVGLGFNGGGSYAGENFKIHFGIDVDYAVGNTSRMRYERRIIVPEVPGVEEDKFSLETRGFLITSQVLPIVYHSAKSMGLRSLVDYDTFRHDRRDKIKIQFDGHFLPNKSSAVIGLVKTVDDLIDSLTTPQH